MIEITCNFCGDSLTTKDMDRVAAFHEEHKNLHPEEHRAALEAMKAKEPALLQPEDYARYLPSEEEEE